MTTKCLQGIELLKIYHILIGETFNIYRFQKIQPKYNVPYVCKKQTKLPSRIDVKPLLRNEYKLQNVSFFQRLANLTQNYPVSHELRQSMTLLMPKSWSSTGKCNKALPPNKEQPKNKSGFKMPWAKKETKQSTTNMQKLPSPKKQTPKPKSKERSSLGARMKSFVVRFIGKSIITGAVLYATLYYRVWGSIDDSVLLYNKIMTCICKGRNYGDSKSRESFDSEPINSSELRDYVVRKYNSNVQWIVCKSIGLPDLAFCYINYYSWLLVDYAKQMYTQVRGDDDD